VFIKSPNAYLIQTYYHFKRVQRKRSVKSQSTPYLSQHRGCPSTQGGTLLVKNSLWRINRGVVAES
jgi:hypothetical protein